MLFTQLELSGHSAKEILEQYGGGLSFSQSLRRRGTGSRKLQYKGGLPELDVLREKYVDYPTVSFQWLTRSLLIRINLANKLYGCYLHHDEIQSIRLYEPKKQGGTEDWLMYRLEIAVEKGPTITFAINYSDVVHFRKFFGRSEVRERFSEK